MPKAVKFTSFTPVSDAVLKAVKQALPNYNQAYHKNKARDIVITPFVHGRSYGYTIWNRGEKRSVSFVDIRDGLTDKTLQLKAFFTDSPSYDYDVDSYSINNLVYNTISHLLNTPYP